MKGKFSRFLTALCALSMLVGCSGGSAPGTTGSTGGTAPGTSGTSGTTTGTSGTTEPVTAGVTSTPVESDEYLEQSGSDYTLYSPDGSLAFKVNTDGQFTYSVTKTVDGVATEWVRPSTMGMAVSNKTLYKNAEVLGVQVNEVKATIPFYGNQSVIEGHCIEAVFSLDSADVSASEYKLEIRAYNDGVAFRYTFPGTGASRNLEELTTYALRTDISECWYGVNNQDYEADITAHKPTENSGDKITGPLTAVVNRNKGYMALMEGALTNNYPGVNYKADGDSTYSTCYYTVPTVGGGNMTTGWRLINIADDLNGLVNNYNIYTVNELPGELYENYADWLEPGRSAWSWCNTHAAPNPEMMREYTLGAALLGYEYNIIDDGWPDWANYKEELAELGAMGDALNVKQILWGAMNMGTLGYNKLPDIAAVDRYFKLLEDTGMYGAKVDFWWSEANLNTTIIQKYILEEAAKRQMVIDFHGCNKNTGLNVTYPNELSREAIKGMENIGSGNSDRYDVYASWLNIQLYTRYLCGHADWTPATYTAMELGSLICIDSPMMAIASDPADILASPACEFIKSIPCVWDRTVVLSDSKIGSYSAYAKEKDGVWFVGGMSSTTKNASVDLSEFLTEDDGSYVAEVWYDTSKGMESKTMTVTAADTIEIGKLTAGKGFAIRLSKLSMSRYGGEIGTVAVTAPEGATVKYTVDGSDPMTSSTAVVCSGTIAVTASCRLRVAITDGEGKGTALSYKFNEISPLYTFDFDINYEDYKTTVTFDADASVAIYYTLDGSTPTTGSAKVSGPVSVTKSCTLKYLAVCGENRYSSNIVLAVRNPITAPKSDIPLTDANPIGTPSVDWGRAHYDESMASDNDGSAARKISLGGSGEYSGTWFDRGISSNANSTYQYAVPSGVKRFVGVVGIDDCVWANTNSSHEAAARLIISFDGVEAYRSEVFRRGEYYFVDIAVPAGASVMTIRFDDAGNGITCDNVSLAAPGWVK